MDKYLTMFSEQLDKEFKPETLFRDKELYIMRLLRPKFIVRKNREKNLKENSMINDTGLVEYA